MLRENTEGQSGLQCDGDTGLCAFVVSLIKFFAFASFR